MNQHIKFIKYFIWLLLPLISVSASLLWNAQYNSIASKAATRQPDVLQPYIDAVVVLDNVSQIASHDPHNDRFAAASLFVDLAQNGDRIGTVEITSSRDATHAPGYHQLEEMPQGRDSIKATFAAEARQGIDTNPTAYFVPALQTAGNMLTDHSRHRYIIVVTDSLAQSGDNAICPNAPDLYKWYCTVGNLEQQGITIIFLAFTTPGHEDEFTQTQNYIRSQGGSAKLLESGSTLIQDLATEYTNIFSNIHRNVFQAQLDEASGNISIAQNANLESLTFVALGNNAVSLSELDQPLQGNIANLNSNGYYHGTGSIYWLETISTGRLDGIWKIAGGTPTLSRIIVLATSKAYLTLDDPSPSRENMDLSVRYIPQQGTILLAIAATAIDGTPLTGIPFTLITMPCCQAFDTKDLPDLTSYVGGDLLTTFTIPPPNGSDTIPLQIALSSPIASGVYLSKTFTLEPLPTLRPISINAPQSSQTPSVSISMQPAQNTNSTQTKFGLFSQEGTNNPWQQLSGNGLQASAPIPYGCGTPYNFAALEQIAGTANGGQYQYLAYATAQDLAQLAPQLEATITSVSGPSFWLSPWNTKTLQWNISFSNTACRVETTSLELHSENVSFPAITFLTSKNNAVNQDTADHQTSVAIVQVPSTGKPFSVQVTARTNNCLSPFSLPTLLANFLSPTRLNRLDFRPLPVPQQGMSLQLTGQLQETLYCPSVVTDLGLHLFQTILGCIFLIWLYLHLNSFISWLKRRSRKPYLLGDIQFISNVPAPTTPGFIADIPITVPIPEGYNQAKWYLCTQGDDKNSLSYEFASEDAYHPVLAFSIGSDESGSSKVFVEAIASQGSNVQMYFDDVNIPLKAGEKYICEGQNIHIENDLLTPHIDITKS